MSRQYPSVSIVLPCRNEEEGLSVCLDEIEHVVSAHNIHAEVIVSDSSTDRSPSIARRYDVWLIQHRRNGYGAAILEGIRHARGSYIFIADADSSYDFRELPAFVDQLRNGADVVIGHRVHHAMHGGAMPWHHKYIGNPLLSFLLRVCTGTRVRDAHCGMRAIRRGALEQIDLHTTGMEFASELILESHRHGLRIAETPIAYRPRRGTSKLRSFRDGWRHLRFILLYSPLVLFFLPGSLLFVAGIALIGWLLFDTITIAGTPLVLHPLFFAATAIIVGYQLMFFAVFARTFAMIHLRHDSPFLRRVYQYLTIEKAGMLGLLLAIAGAGVFIYIVTTGSVRGASATTTITHGILALTLVVLGVQTLFSTFILSLLGLKKNV